MVINRQATVRVPIAALEVFLARVKGLLRIRRREVGICLVEDREIRRMNRTFRGKNKATDVLSFPAGERNGYLGDIAISPAAARRNARLYGRTVPLEMRILVLHGVLHLLGHDHENDQGEMLRLESRLRRKLRLA